MDSESTFTEVVITEVHAAAARILSGRRLSEYLSAELRGPLLATGADVSIHDGLARGLAPKHFRVVPRRYTGEPLNLPATVEVPGYSAMRIELYFARGAERPAVELACAGTLVADDLGGLASLGLAEPPWLGRGLSGLIDFADFAVPPGTRRGVVPDAAAEAFARALGELAPLVSAELDRMDRERGAAANRQVMNDLRRAFRGLRNRLPQYELPAVEGEGEAAASRTSGILPLGESPGADPAEDPPGEGGDDGETGRERRVRAVATDDAGRALGAAPDLTFAWSANPDVLSIVGGGPRPALLAAATARPGMRETFQVLARQGERVATASATATVVDPADVEAGGKLGIPEPELLDEPGAGWRSRFLGQRWQVNSGHEDFAALAGDAKSRLRYLLTLLAKEIVARTHGGPGADSALEGLVEILAHTERNLRGG
jgi:hypothetical protein